MKLYNSLNPEFFYDLYGTLISPDNLKETVRKFQKINWSVRKSSWTEFEIESEWAEFNLFENNDGTIFSGVILKNKISELENILKDFGYKYKLELEKEDKVVMIKSNK